jgi:hypothetical protein
MISAATNTSNTNYLLVLGITARRKRTRRKRKTILKTA